MMRVPLRETFPTLWAVSGLESSVPSSCLFVTSGLHANTKPRCWALSIPQHTCPWPPAGPVLLTFLTLLAPTQHPSADRRHVAAVWSPDLHIASCLLELENYTSPQWVCEGLLFILNCVDNPERLINQVSDSHRVTFHDDISHGADRMNTSVARWWWCECSDSWPQMFNERRYMQNIHPPLHILFACFLCLGGARPCTVSPVSGRQTLVCLLFCRRLRPDTHVCCSCCTCCLFSPMPHKKFTQADVWNGIMLCVVWDVRSQEQRWSFALGRDEGNVLTEVFERDKPCKTTGTCMLDRTLAGTS